MADYDLQYQDTHIDALLATANELKTAGYIYKGVATPSTNPGTPTGRVAYLASEPGTYTNFGGIVIASGLYSLTYAGGTWTGTQMSAGSDIEVVQTTGDSTTDVMSQKAVTDEINDINVKTNNSGNADLDLADWYGNVLVKFNNGGIQTKKFNSENYPFITDDFENGDFGIADWYGNVVLKVANGQIYTSKFSSNQPVKPYPPLCLYRLNKKTYNDIETSWTTSISYAENNTIGIDSGFLLNRQYAMNGRKLVYDFTLSANSSACFGTKVGITRGQYMSTDDFIRIGTDGNIQTFTYNQYSSATAKKNIGTATITADTRYRLVIDKCGEWNKDVTKITIFTFDLLKIVFETELLQSANNNLSFYDCPFCFCESGTVKLYDLCVMVPNVCYNRKLAIFGDSITEGWAAGVDGWAHLVARHIGKAFCQVSGRDTSTIDDVIERVYAECASNPPQYIMVTIGTNGGNTLAKLQSLIDLILSYDSIPILNHVSSPASANTLIDQAIASYPNTFIGCCKMDEAVALGNSYAGTDGTHPNTAGHNLMYQQVIKDMPELFDNL